MTIMDLVTASTLALLGAVLALGVSARWGLRSQRKNMGTKVTELPDFNASQTVLSTEGNAALAFDEGRQKVCFTGAGSEGIHVKALSPKELRTVELIEDGTTIAHTKRKAQKSNPQASGTGPNPSEKPNKDTALKKKGSSSQRIKRIDLRITAYDPKWPSHEINFLDTQLDFNERGVTRRSSEYKEALKGAQYWHTLLGGLITQAEDERGHQPEEESREAS